MTSLVIDIGNTLTKMAIFKNDDLIVSEQYQQPEIDEVSAFLSGHSVDKIIVSSVKKGQQPWQEALQPYKVISFNSSMATGINNHYKTPQTLGPDRLAAVIGANYLFPQQNNIIIGGGTTITYDYVDAGKNYFGGSISPGLKMRYKALNYYTGALPLVEADASFDKDTGDDTQTAITSGVQNGIKYELTGFIENYVKTQKAYNIILHGGDSIFFDTLLKNSIFAPYIKIEPYLVLKGLNAAIQQHND